ncbi:MAG: hypothetical protein HC879_20720 [Leptolyngbyaceae cyanobacterium SL_5_9]|nr:hypothetical protein [Leptolyngbyaceae cyanobacterium SL_5_9]NJO74046.1 hypothetical protein [Leptolyngbyaceae cyanobacterium RM1_406_9]
MKIQPLAVGLLGLIATSGIVYGAVSSVEPASVAPTSTSIGSDSSSPLPSSFPLLETPVASVPVEDSSSAASPEQEQSSTPLYKQLEGTWSSDLMTVTFDWKQGLYSGVLLDQPFSKSLELVREQENAVVFTTNGSEMIGRFQPDGTIALVTKGEDNPPIVLRKAS